jgi:hypothetical protein
MHPTLLYMNATVTTYALTNLALIVSIYKYENGNVYQYIIINKMLYATRYITDIFPIIEVVVLYINKNNRKFIVTSIVSSITLVALLYYYLGENIIYDTFVFNKQSFINMQKSGAIDNEISNVQKFINLRKEEMKSWYGIYSILIVSLFYFLRNKDEKAKIKIKQYMVYIIIIICFYYYTLNDYPITKITLIPLILLIYAEASQFIPKLVKIIIISINIVPIFNINIPYMANKKDNQLALCEYIDCSKRTLSINPILQTLSTTKDTKLIMELYSFAQNDKRYGLYSANEMLQKIKQKEYDNIILDERFLIRKNMSKMISEDVHAEIINELDQVYEIKKKYFDNSLGMNIYAYTIK